jgi:hypothetical protein
MPLAPSVEARHGPRFFDLSFFVVAESASTARIARISQESKPLSIPTRERSEIGASVADRETRTLAMR